MSKLTNLNIALELGSSSLREHTALETASEKYASENNLVTGCQAKDKQCQRMLYELHAPAMLMICKRYMSDTSRAKDVMHESFIKAYSGIGKFRGGSKVKSWLTRIMINESINALKKDAKQWRFDQIELDDFEYESTSEEAAWQELNEKKTELQIVFGLMNRLPLGCRTILNLYAVEKYSHAEIASLLKISIGNSKSQLSRARKSLRIMLEIEKKSLSK